VAVFFSFHYDRDVARVQQVLQMGALEGQTILSSQKWEEVKSQGDKAIERWIDDQMKYKSAVVVLVGSQTASRDWVRYEITKAWRESRPLVGVRIHGLKDFNQKIDAPGANPFEKVSLKNGKKVSDYVTLHSPPGTDSRAVYASIKANLNTWVNGAYKRS
jgi:hypothetical protein